MTIQEKLTAILERVPLLDDSYTPQHISLMVITSYLDTLSKEGLIEAMYSVTSLGRNVVAICEEFDWQPSDEDVTLFINDMVKASDRDAFFYIITQYRDNKEEFMEKLKKFKDGRDNNI